MLGLPIKIIIYMIAGRPEKQIDRQANRKNCK